MQDSKLKIPKTTTAMCILQIMMDSCNTTEISGGYTPLQTPPYCDQYMNNIITRGLIWTLVFEIHIGL